MKDKPIEKRIERLPELKGSYPDRVFRAICSASVREGISVYVVGGAMRDWLLGERVSGDIDLTVGGGAHAFCRSLIETLGGGAFVPLGTESDEASRVVWQGLDIDVSSFRGEAETIEDDLALRDFSINSIAAPLELFFEGRGTVIDPMDGIPDLKAGVIRHCPRAFTDDPLRLLRAFRFMVLLGFRLAASTAEEIDQHASKICCVAVERVGYELDRIITAGGGAAAFMKMHEVGLLRPILPELYQGEGVEQPGFHHLDVFRHNLKALEEVERLLNLPDYGFPGYSGRFAKDLARKGAVRELKWSALLHDVGKPTARREPESRNGRVTFYGHDEYGRELVESLGRRLKWSNEERDRVSRLVAMHMHPFHLCTVQKENGLTRRAAMKLCSRAGDQLQLLFLLAMADSLSSRGELKPETMEEELVDLYGDVVGIYDQHIRPVLDCSPLLGGRDLIEECDLQPGPVFSVILNELQALQVEGVVESRDEALRWVRNYLKTQGTESV